MRRFIGVIGLAVALVGAASSQAIDTTIYAVQYERDAQNNSNWVGQTVRVTGVITALTGVTGTRNIFIQMDQCGPWSGIMVYFPSGLGTLPQMNIGDSVVVTAGVLEYYNNTELQVNNLADFQIVGNRAPLQPSIITCAHLDTTATSDFPVDSAEAYEGVLVKLMGVYITRTGLGANNEFEVTDGSGFVIVRNNFSYTPNVGDAMNITGIVEERTLGGVRYYMLRPRSVNDFEFLTPGIADAFSIDINKVLVKFKTPMNPATANDPSKYQIVDSVTGTLLSIISAELSTEDQKTVILTTQEMENAARYMLNTPGLRDIYNQSINDTFYFYGGFTPITLIQSDTLPGDEPNGFRSKWNGRSVTITGIVTGWKDKFSYPFFFVQQGVGPWTGIHGWDPTNFIPLNAMTEGDSVILVGEILEYGTNAITEIQNLKYYRVVSSGHTVNPVVVPLPDLRNEAGAISEQWEHVLVAVEPPIFVYDVGTGGDWRVYKFIEPDTFVLTVEGDYAIGYTWRPTEAHQQIDYLAGILRYRGTLYPRTDADITPSSVREGIYRLAVSSFSNGILKVSIDRDINNAKIELYSVDGKRVAVLSEGIIKAGTLRFDVSKLSSGLYFLRVSEGDRAELKRVIIVR
ncbi:MAG: T9SS type A sorting domain-containing protein [candidate division WOR-3 bacterium]